MLQQFSCCELWPLLFQWYRHRYIAYYRLIRKGVSRTKWKVTMLATCLHELPYDGISRGGNHWNHYEEDKRCKFWRLRWQFAWQWQNAKMMMKCGKTGNPPPLCPLMTPDTTPGLAAAITVQHPSSNLGYPRERGGLGEFGEWKPVLTSPCFSKVPVHTLFLSFFSMGTIFGSIFSMQKYINCDKIDFATNQRKLQRKLIFATK